MKIIEKVLLAVYGLLSLYLVKVTYNFGGLYNKEETGIIGIGYMMLMILFAALTFVVFQFGFMKMLGKIRKK